MFLSRTGAQVPGYRADCGGPGGGTATGKQEKEEMRNSLTLKNDRDIRREMRKTLK